MLVVCNLSHCAIGSDLHKVDPVTEAAATCCWCGTSCHNTRLLVDVTVTRPTAKTVLRLRRGAPLAAAAAAEKRKHKTYDVECARDDCCDPCCFHSCLSCLSHCRPLSGRRRPSHVRLCRDSPPLPSLASSSSDEDRARHTGLVPVCATTKASLHPGSGFLFSFLSSTTHSPTLASVALSFSLPGSCCPFFCSCP